MRSQRQRFVRTLVFVSATIFCLIPSEIGTAGIFDHFRKQEVPTDPFLEVATEEPTLTSAPPASSESPVTSVSPVSYENIPEPSNAVRLVDTQIAAPSDSPVSLVETAPRTDRFGNPIVTPTVVPSTGPAPIATVSAPKVEPPPVPESLRLTSLRSSDVAIDPTGTASSEFDSSDPLSPSRIGQSLYGSPRNYELDSLSQSMARKTRRSWGPLASPEPETLTADLHDERGRVRASESGLGEVGDESGLPVNYNPTVEYADPWTRLGWLVTGWPDEKKAYAAYEDAIGLFKQEKYLEAASKFQEASSRWPASAIQEDSLFMRAESFFFADHYSAAYTAYCEVFKYYEFSRYTDVISRRLFLIAQYWDQYSLRHPTPVLVPNFWDRKRPVFDVRGNAVKCYESVRMYDPIGPLADDAVMASAGVYFADKKWCDAARQYAVLNKEYPNSDYQLQSNLLQIQSLCFQYQGERYEVTSLREAGKLIDQARIRFHGQLGEEEAELLETRRQIVEHLAQREFAMGKYYDSKGYYRAARIYYESVVLNYENTESAEQATQRLSEIKSFPDEPIDHLAWVEKILPSRKK